MVPPDALGAYLSGLEEILRSADTDAVVFGHAGDANVHVNPLLDVQRRTGETMPALSLWKPWVWWRIWEAHFPESTEMGGSEHRSSSGFGDRN